MVISTQKQATNNNKFKFINLNLIIRRRAFGDNSMNLNSNIKYLQSVDKGVDCKWIYINTFNFQLIALCVIFLAFKE
jgi:hypothetical protein